MGQIVRLLKSVGDLLVGLVKFIPKLLHDLLVVVNVVIEAFTQLPTIFVVFPTIISTLLLSVFGVVIVYKVLGREG